MEFLNDRFVTLDINWDMNGKIFNRIPILHKLKWREKIGVRGMVGHLTDKNNPFLGKNSNSDFLFVFPEGTHLMNGAEPYMEFHVGIHNIFKFFEVDYVRRMSYTGFHGVKKHGVRFTFEFSF